MFFIVRLGLGAEGHSEVYHILKSVTREAAFQEAAEYMQDDGVPVTGNTEDTFQVAETVSGPITARLSFLASMPKDKEHAQGVLLKALKEGEVISS